MSLAEKIFGKPLYSISEADLISYFSVEQEENSVVEYKSGKVELQKVLKEIVAFLNTEGGLLIIGAPEESQADKTKHKVCVGNLTAWNSVKDQDSFIRILATQISPSPIGIKIQTVSTKIGFVYIVEIAQSFTPPHQVNGTGTYYIRLEREAKPAPHGVIEALFLRRQLPNLKIEASSYNSKTPDSPVELNFSISNESIITAESVGIICLLVGVKKVSNATGIFENANLLSDSVRVDYFEKDRILVKGLQIPFSIDLFPLYPEFYVSIACYCFHTQIQSRAFIVGSSGDVLKQFDSTGLSDNTQLDSLQEEFRKNRSGHFANLLNVEVTNDGNDRERIIALLNLKSELNFAFPDDLFSFYEIIDGYDNTVNGVAIKLFSIQELSEQTSFEHNDFKGFRIGLLRDSPLSVILYDNKEIRYSLMVWRSNLPTHHVETRTLFEMLSIQLS